MIFQSPYMSYPYRYNRNYFHNSYLPNQSLRPSIPSRCPKYKKNRYNKR